MSINTKKTSSKVAMIASKTLQSKNASQIQKSLAGSVLAQSNSNKQTGKEIEKKASQALKSSVTNAKTKTLAASAISQSNKQR